MFLNFSTHAPLNVSYFYSGPTTSAVGSLFALSPSKKLEMGPLGNYLQAFGQFRAFFTRLLTFLISCILFQKTYSLYFLRKGAQNFRTRSFFRCIAKSEQI